MERSRPATLPVLAEGSRLWERRPTHDDFARIRIGAGSRRAALEFLPPQTRPVEDLEPLTAMSLRRFTRAHQRVPHLPVPMALRRFTSVEFAGSGADVLALMRAMVGQLAVLHAPNDLRIALLGRGVAATEWEWLKWLPHNQHPEETDAAGPVRLAADDHERELLTTDLSGANGHIGVVGAPQTGKSTLLRTLMMSLALTHIPQDVQFYCLDFGGGLASIGGLPHVGSVAGRLDRDRVLRTVAEMTQLLERRERTFAERGLETMVAYRALRAEGAVDDPYGDVFVVVDGWATLRSEYEDAETVLMDLAARGLAFGLHLVGSAVRRSEFRPRLRDLMGTELELRLGDAVDSEVGSRIAATVPDQPGRGLVASGHHFLSVLARIDGSAGTEDLTTAIRPAAAEINTFWIGRPAPEVRLLPARLPAGQLPPPADTEELRLCLGLDEQRLAPTWHDFGTTPHLMVFGDGEAGKTNAPRLAIRAVLARYTADEARILAADPGRGLLRDIPEPYRVGYAVDGPALTELMKSAAVSLGKRVPGPEITPEQLPRRDWWHGPRLFVVIDDYDLLSSGPGMNSPASPLVDLLAQGQHIGLHLIVARSPSGAARAVMDPLLRRVWELGNPALLLSYQVHRRGPNAPAATRPRPAGHPALDRSGAPGTGDLRVTATRPNHFPATPSRSGVTP
ncbi:type VII secretion protein EccCb [Streptomyces sp. Ru62]|uniref:type VII secretion protein EccCb n=1 Tax=Streptomyces sp. Ru62 TaxID=2080745 RepID=UPI0021560167|nr:type VII secretion protein EccCb [Streptomyces sp. Ru62]